MQPGRRLTQKRRVPSVLFYACTLLTHTMARETQISRDDSYPLLLCRRSCARSPWAFSFKKLQWCGGVDDLRDEGRLIMSRVPSVRACVVSVCNARTTWKVNRRLVLQNFTTRTIWWSDYILMSSTTQNNSKLWVEYLCLFLCQPGDVIMFYKT